jgi:uncharacterized tellurite resistance protein B-like protein
MYSPDIVMGLGCIIYALLKSDGPFQPNEAKAVRQLLAEYPHSSLAIGAVFLRDNVGESSEEAFAFGLRRMAYQRSELNLQTKKRFVHLLLRVANVHDGISRKERAFIWRFWREIKPL